MARFFFLLELRRRPVQPKWYMASRAPRRRPEKGLVVLSREVGLTGTSATATSSGTAGRRWWLSQRKCGSWCLKRHDHCRRHVESAGEARPSRIEKHSVTSASEPEFAESSDEESSPRERVQQWTAQRLWDEEERELPAQEALWAAREASVSQQDEPFAHRGPAGTTRRRIW